MTKRSMVWGSLDRYTSDFVINFVNPSLCHVNHFCQSPSLRHISHFFSNPSSLFFWLFFFITLPLLFFQLFPSFLTILLIILHHTDTIPPILSLPFLLFFSLSFFFIYIWYYFLYISLPFSPYFAYKKKVITLLLSFNKFFFFNYFLQLFSWFISFCVFL